MKNHIPIVNPDVPLYSHLHKDIQKVIDSKQLTKGIYLEKLEKSIREYCGVRYAIGVSNCTLGLMLVLRCLQLKGEVIIPSFTFIATAEALLWNGLKPVFVDIDEDTLNIDHKKIEDAITEKTCAILAVHVFGNPANITTLQKIAKRHTLKLIYDAAHAFGSIYNNTYIGNFGDAEVFSMSPTKLLIAGEGGIITTNNAVLAQKLIQARDYGNCGNGLYNVLGLNARLPEVNAIIAYQSIKKLKQAIKQRNIIAKLYSKQLSIIPGISFQYINENSVSTYKDFSILIDGKQFGMYRDALKAELLAHNIEVRTYFDPPLHKQPLMAQYPFKSMDLHITEIVSSSIISLPIWSTMDTHIASKICSQIQKIYNKVHHAK